MGHVGYRVIDNFLHLLYVKHLFSFLEARLDNRTTVPKHLNATKLEKMKVSSPRFPFQIGL